MGHWPVGASDCWCYDSARCLLSLLNAALLISRRLYLFVRLTVTKAQGHAWPTKNKPLPWVLEGSWGSFCSMKLTLNMYLSQVSMVLTIIWNVFRAIIRLRSVSVRKNLTRTMKDSGDERPLRWWMIFGNIESEAIKKGLMPPTDSAFIHAWHFSTVWNGQVCEENIS